MTKPVAVRTESIGLRRPTAVRDLVLMEVNPTIATVPAGGHHLIRRIHGTSARLVIS